MFNLIYYKHKIFNVQSDKLCFFLFWILQILAHSEFNVYNMFQKDGIGGKKGRESCEMLIKHMFGTFYIRTGKLGTDWCHD